MCSLRLARPSRSAKQQGRELRKPVLPSRAVMSKQRGLPPLHFARSRADALPSLSTCSFSDQYPCQRPLCCPGIRSASAETTKQWLRAYLLECQHTVALLEADTGGQCLRRRVLAGAVGHACIVDCTRPPKSHTQRGVHIPRTTIDRIFTSMHSWVLVVIAFLGKRSSWPLLSSPFSALYVGQKEHCEHTLHIQDETLCQPSGACRNRMNAATRSARLLEVFRGDGRRCDIRT